MDHIPIATFGQQPNVTTLALCDHGPWPWSDWAEIIRRSVGCI